MVENRVVGVAKILEELSFLLSSSYGRRATGGGSFDGKVAMRRQKVNPGKRADTMGTKKERKKILPPGGL